MNYKEYSYPKRNMKFVADLMCHIRDKCEITKDQVGLSIGCEDMVHEDALMIHSGCKICILNDLEIYNAEFNAIPYSANRFDFVFLKSVIEHINGTDWFLKQIRKVLKPNGKLIILTPDFQKQGSFFYDDYTHIKPFTLRSLAMALTLNGYDVSHKKWFWYYKAIWEKKILPNFLPIRFAYFLTQITGIKYFRWGADRQLFVIGVKHEQDSSNI